MAEVAPLRGGLAPWQVRRVVLFMEENLHRPIGLEDLAALAGLSRFHFCTTFRISTGRTPYEWLIARRMARACELLARPDLRVTEIAFAVGYETPSAFSTGFRKYLGMTPSDYRRLQLASDAFAPVDGGAEIERCCARAS